MHGRIHSCLLDHCSLTTLFLLLLAASAASSSEPHRHRSLSLAAAKRSELHLGRGAADLPRAPFPAARPISAMEDEGGSLGTEGGDARCGEGSAPATTRTLRDVVREESLGYDIASPGNVARRAGYLPWDEYFLAVACLSARRSKDPRPSGSSRNGACIVDAMGRIVGIGYDGFPRGCSDDCLPWASPSSAGDDAAGEEEVAWLHSREPYLCRAEINAILNKCSSDVVGGRMFAPNFPSNECAKFIIQSGIKEIIYVRDDDECSESSRASRILFEVSGVKMTRMKPSIPSVKISFGAESGREPREAPKAPRRDEEEMEKYLGVLQREASIDPFQFKVTKRADYLSWDEYFMGVAFLSAQRSKDPNTQVGACIVDADRRIVGMGYNGFPRGCDDAVLPWSRRGPSSLHTKYPYVVHAEVNAILNKCAASVRGATIYVALFPCNECSKVIIQSGIREVVYLDDYYHDTDSCRASRIMFKMAGVKLRQYHPEHREIVIDLES